MLTNTTATLDQLQQLVGKRVTIWRQPPPRLRHRAFAVTGRLDSASGPHSPDVGYAVSYSNEREASFLALPPDWTWTIRPAD